MKMRLNRSRSSSFGGYAHGTNHLMTSCWGSQIELIEWTGESHLRHSKFIGLREDKNPEDVVKE